MTKANTGIRKTATGWQAYVWVVDPAHPKGGYQASKRFDPNATLTEMKQWRMAKRLNVVPDETVSTFAQDAAAYLEREKVKTMPTRDERERHIAEWVTRFGWRVRTEIQPHEIQAALDALRGKMSAGSVNKRRTALMDLWTTLDGRHQANPVKATRPYEEPHPEPRAPELAAVLTLLKGLPAKTDFGLKCRARLKVITWTGWPHAIVKGLQESDRQFWKEGRAFVGRRKKGKGARARWLPLLPEAQKALAEFHRVDAYGHFSNSSLHKRMSKACRDLKLPHIRPYDLRHFFGTLIATLTQDERVLMELLLVSTPSIVRRYTEAATNPRVQAAVADIAKQVPDLVKAAGRINRHAPVAALPESRRSA